MRVAMSVGARFTIIFRLAEYLEKIGSLEKVITFTPKFRMPGLAVSDEHLEIINWLGGVNYLVRYNNFIGGPWGRQWVADRFDRAVSRRLPHCEVFFGWCGCALHSMRAASTLGAKTVVGSGSTHLAFQKEVVEAEYAKLGLRHVATDPKGIEKAALEYAEADLIIVNSGLARRTFVERGVPERKIAVIRHDQVGFEARLHPAGELGNRPSDGIFRILAVGHMTIRKGLHYLLEAVARLKLPKSELILVGPVDESFRPFLARYSGVYAFAGPVSSEDLAMHYSRASVFVLPSVEDGWGQVTTEAMSHGLPVIVSANAGSADAVKEGVNGYVVPACNTEAIMEKLDYLYRNPELAREMGMRGRLGVSERTWMHYGEDITRTFSDLLARS